jgi:hypothetical protein
MLLALYSTCIFLLGVLGAEAYVLPRRALARRDQYPQGGDSTLALKFKDCLNLRTGNDTSLSIVTASSPGYDAARKVFNLRIDRYPLAVAFPIKAEHVASVVRCSADLGITPVPRTGGHSYEGFSVLDGQITVDVSKMNDIKVDQSTQTAVVQAGTLLGNLYYKVFTSAGFAFNAGSCPSVGLSGHALGGNLIALLSLSLDFLIPKRIANAESISKAATVSCPGSLAWLRIPSSHLKW